MWLPITFAFKSLTFLLAASASCACEQRFSKNCSSRSAYPIITGEVFRNLCHHKIDETSFDPEQVEEGDLIFASCTNLEFLFSVINKIKNRFILVSHLTPVSRFDLCKFLDNPKIIAWFAKNADASHPKLHFLPNGVGRVSRNTNFEVKFDPLRTNIVFCPTSKKYSILTQVSLLNWTDKKHFLCLNFTMRYNKKDRQPLYDLFKKKNYCSFFTTLPYKEYLETLLNSCFVLSPRGSGLDCYRTWESLACGSFPVVLSSCLDKEFKDLPVVIAPSWEAVTEQYLLQKMHEFSEREFNFEKLLSDYWIKKIMTVRDRYAPNAKKIYLCTNSQNEYLGFQLEPFEAKVDSDFSSAVERWVNKNNVTNVVTYDPSAAIPLAQAIPTYGRVIVVADLSEQQRLQFLSNILHLFLAQKVVLYSSGKWEKHPINCQLPVFDGEHY